MTVIKHRAFEASTPTADFDAISDASTLLSYATDQFKNGAKAFKVAAGAVVARVDANLPASKRSASCRAWVRFSAFPATAQQVWAYRTAGGVVMAVRVNSSGVLSQIVGVTSANSGLTISTNTWYLFDMKADTSTTTFSVSLRVTDASGTVLLNTHDQTEAGNTAADISVLRYGRNSTTSWEMWYDDAMESDTSADYPLGWDFTAPRVHAMVGT